MWGNRWESPNTHCVIEMGRRGANGVEKTLQVRGSTYPLFNQEFSFPIEHGGHIGKGNDILLEASKRNEMELGTMILKVLLNALLRVTRRILYPTKNNNSDVW